MASTIPNPLLYKFVPKVAMPSLTDISCDLKRKAIYIICRITTHAANNGWDLISARVLDLKQVNSSVLK